MVYPFLIWRKEVAIRFHNCIERYNILNSATNRIAPFFNSHPTAYKIALIVNHLFRVAAMVGFMFIPGMPLIPGMAICVVGSVFYRLTVEKNCAYKFALPALFGAAAVMLAIPAVINLMHTAGATSILSGFKAGASFMPLAFYAIYIILTVSYDVDKTLGRLPSQQTPNTCCSKHNPF